jgi:hypothetical protein
MSPHVTGYGMKELVRPLIWFSLNFAYFLLKLLGIGTCREGSVCPYVSSLRLLNGN